MAENDTWAEEDKLFMEFFQSVDESYAQQWAVEAQKWDQVGVYEFIANAIAVKPNGFHLDVGSGWGHLLATLHSRLAREKTDMRLIGIEINTMLAVGSMVTLERAKIGAAIYHNVRTVRTVQSGGNLFFSRAYAFDPRSAANIGITSDALPAISVVVDDVRQASVIRAVLAERRVSSATLMFPGSSARPAYETPHRIEGLLPVDKETTHIREALAAFRRGTFALLTDVMEPGGQFLMVERAVKESVQTDDDFLRLIADQTCDLFGEHAKHWQLQRQAVTHMDDVGVRSPLLWVSDRGSSESLTRGGKAGVALTVTELIRA